VPEPLKSEHRTFQTLKKRAEFQRVRGGGRATAVAFILEGKPRQQPSISGPATHKTGTQSACSQSEGGPRFGFTITKKIGNAVVRNLIRRRLRAALVEISPLVARPDTDYVLVARIPAASQNFASLVADLKTAFGRVHASGLSKPDPASSKPRPTDKKGVTEGLSHPSPRSATSTQQNKSSRD
jgi:ribonuclease P protein component